MHSPPVQPSSSSTSGTGSVITMWLEVRVSARRSGRKRSSEPPAPRIAAPARTRPPGVAATTASTLSVSESTRVCSWISTPASRTRVRRPAASRAGWTVAAIG